MNILYIDTSDNKNVFAKVKVGELEFMEKSDAKNLRPDSIVNLIEKALKKADTSLDKIDNIKVNEGPGSYTGLKVGVSVANALSFALGKSVNDLSIGSLADVKYD